MLVTVIAKAFVVFDLLKTEIVRISLVDINVGLCPCFPVFVLPE
jgi:hypothetical protein